MPRFVSASGVLALCALLSLGPWLPAVAESREAPPTTLYRLGGESSFLSGCIVGLCLCPVRLTYMAGILGVTPAGHADGFQVYAISDIDWFTHAQGQVWDVITGSGAYHVGDETHRIVLELQVNGADPITVDSGVVPGGAAFPAINIGGLTDTLCFQEGVDLYASSATSSIEVSLVEPDMVAWTVGTEAGAYDLVAGDLMMLRDTSGDFTTSSRACLASGVEGTAMAYTEPVQPGAVVWFLVRGLPGPGFDSGGEGQVGLRDQEIDASPMACP